MDHRLSTYLLLWAVIAFLGFCLENIWLAIRKGYIDNRNMSLPFLMGYGAAVIGIYFVFGTHNKPSVLITMLASHGYERILYIADIFLAVSIGEITLGKTVEHLCGIRYWDYSSLPMHITPYTSVPTSLCFTVIIVLYMDKCFIQLAGRLDSLPAYPAFAAGSMVFGLMAIDLVRSFYVMYRTRALNERWRIQVVGEQQEVVDR